MVRRSPDGERPGDGSPLPGRSIFQSTLPGWGATFRHPFCFSFHMYFNPRSPDGERRVNWYDDYHDVVFQSTLPGWGATRRCARWCAHVPNFNPRSPDGERPATPLPVGAPWVFQSTLPGWGATGVRPRRPDPVVISIHAPRMGSDSGHQHKHRLDAYFNPRSPDGERPVTVPPWPIVPIFQSTLPGWGATRRHPRRFGQTPGYFNPRSPDGERRLHRFDRGGGQPISIHAPRMGSDALRANSRKPCSNFNPRSPDGERPRKWTSSPTIWAKSSIFNTDCIADRR